MSTDNSSSPAKNSNGADSHSRIAAEAKLLKLYLQLLLEVRTARPGSVTIELLPDQIVFQLIADGSEAGAAPLKT